ncbi:uncharacterized protein LOC142904454 [Nelusetta ayraudi]|uniref:uncharacterized protein LOC142904454 n=1 Tax=Nelusetta ayraudi TaxID=303726 RepID=UPI003F70948A
MTGDVAQAPHQQTDPVAPSEEPADAECPICYQQYNHFNKSPRTLECAHVFCAECLQRIQLRPSEPPDPRSPPAIPCPLCRHLTPLEAPCTRSVAYHLPGAVAARLATVTQRVVFSVEGENRDARFIILPTVSLQVQQMHPDPLYGMAAGLSGEEEVTEQSKKTLLCVQLLAVTFWVLFVITCVVGVVFGPHFLNRKL